MLMSHTPPPRQLRIRHFQPAELQAEAAMPPVQRASQPGSCSHAAVAAAPAQFRRLHADEVAVLAAAPLYLLSSGCATARAPLMPLQHSAATRLSAAAASFRR